MFSNYAVLLCLPQLCKPDLGSSSQTYLSDLVLFDFALVVLKPGQYLGNKYFHFWHCQSAFQTIIFQFASYHCAQLLKNAWLTSYMNPNKGQKNGGTGGKMRILKNFESQEMDRFGCHLFLTAWEVIEHLRGCEVFQDRHPLCLYSVSSRIWEKYPVQYIWSDFRSRKTNPAISTVWWWKDQYVKVTWGRNLTIRLILDLFWKSQLKGDPHFTGPLWKN